MADRIGHANMAYTLSIYAHRSTGGRTSDLLRPSPGFFLALHWVDVPGDAVPPTSATRLKTGSVRRAELTEQLPRQETTWNISTGAIVGSEHDEHSYESGRVEANATFNQERYPVDRSHLEPYDRL